MNVLILTPDRVGSNLLQRVLTVYMLRQGFGRPVRNLHEITTGIIKYYDTDLKQEVLAKPKSNWGYYQTLSEISSMITSVDHYTTSRMAHYNMVRRQDPIGEQLNFYEFLNQNFYIISCRRRNVFEHVLSWGILTHSKQLNAYSANEKIEAFQNIYANGIELQEPSMIKYLDQYRDYLIWVDRYFEVQSYFNYEDSINNLEEYILNLDFMTRNNNTWKDMFGVEFNDWNRIHKILPDIQMLQQKQTQYQLESNTCVFISVDRHTWDTWRAPDWPDYKIISNEQYSALPVEIKQDLAERNWITSIQLTPEVKQLLEKNLIKYQDSTQEIQRLVNRGYLSTGIPIKLQTFKEKKLIIRNFDQCIDWYNNWAIKNGFEQTHDFDIYTQLESTMDRLLPMLDDSNHAND